MHQTYPNSSSCHHRTRRNHHAPRPNSTRRRSLTHKRTTDENRQHPGEVNTRKQKILKSTPPAGLFLLYLCCLMQPSVCLTALLSSAATSSCVPSQAISVSCLPCSLHILLVLLCCVKTGHAVCRSFAVTLRPDMTSCIQSWPYSGLGDGFVLCVWSSLENILPVCLVV